MALQRKAWCLISNLSLDTTSACRHESQTADGQRRWGVSLSVGVTRPLCDSLVCPTRACSWTQTRNRLMYAAHFKSTKSHIGCNVKLPANTTDILLWQVGSASAYIVIFVGSTCEVSFSPRKVGQNSCHIIELPKETRKKSHTLCVRGTVVGP